ncbi:hypothetical protein E2C01_052453 [Portunus trituberculatus]|uniref:Uncharacterized protein n=1 Tax=Portunus trituberculatus TaxID=210409 RepID=A0A5B7GMH8_PORTR|nr:hypothetical protein [Portunus trituberculatus]
MKVCHTSRSNGIRLKNAVKLSSVKIKVTDTDCICFGSYNVWCMVTWQILPDWCHSM